MIKEPTIEMLDYLSAVDATDEELAIIFKRMSEIEGIDAFLRLLLKKDIIAYFNAPIEAQGLARGAYMRTKWIFTGIKKSRVTKEDALKTFNKKSKRNLTKSK